MNIILSIITKGMIAQQTNEKSPVRKKIEVKIKKIFQINFFCLEFIKITFYAIILFYFHDEKS